MFDDCYHIWFGVSTMYLEVVDEEQRRICNSIDHDLAYRLHSFSTICLSGKQFHGYCSDELSCIVANYYESKFNIRMRAKSHHFINELDRCNRKFYVDMSFSRTSPLEKSLLLPNKL